MVDIEDLGIESISDVNVLVSEYRFVVKHAKTIGVKIWLTDRDYGGDRYYLTQSHFFHGPKQAGPYTTSVLFAPSEEAALRKTIGTFTTFFPDLEEYPNADPSVWFIANEDY